MKLLKKGNSSKDTFFTDETKFIILSSRSQAITYDDE